MNRRICRHRMNERDVIDAGTDIWKQIRDPLSGFAVLLEFPFWLDDPALTLLAAATKGFHIDRLSIHSDHVRLVVERVDMAGAAVVENEDDAFGFPGSRGRFCFERVCETTTMRGRCIGFIEKAVHSQHTRQGKGREAASDVVEHLTAIDVAAER